MAPMRVYASLTRRGEVGRLRRLAHAALGRFGVRDARLRLLRHEHNTTFRVDAPGGPYLLRLNRSGVHDERTVASEMAWLSALAQETDLGVPLPTAADDGSFVVIASEPGVPDPRPCVLLRWQPGRLVDRRLAPTHLAAVGDLIGQLQLHALRWTPSEAFVRPRVATLTTDARRASVSGPASATRGRHPTQPDEASAVELVERLVSSAGASVVTDALALVRRSTGALARTPQASGLMHADLHYENVLFHRGVALAIDFDDCGWGVHLYDLAVTLSELEDRRNYDALRDALLDGYAKHRPLPDRYDDHLRALAILRRVQLVLWILESRDLAAFRDDWRRWASKDLAALASAIQR